MFILTPTPGPVGSFKKKLQPKRALSDIYLTERARPEAVIVLKLPIKKKLLPKRAISSIHLPERARTKYGGRYGGKFANHGKHVSVEIDLTEKL